MKQTQSLEQHNPKATLVSSLLLVPLKVKVGIRILVLVKRNRRFLACELMSLCCCKVHKYTIIKNKKGLWAT